MRKKDFMMGRARCPQRAAAKTGAFGWRRRAEDVAPYLLTLFVAMLVGCSRSNDRTVVVYTSQDQIYIEPIFAQFTKETGIKVLPLFDSESVKTAGLVQRLLAEKDNPKADIFWSNEEMLAHQLIERGILESDFQTGYRTRRMVVNTNLVALADAPKNLEELTQPKWSGKVAMAYPVYGTTVAHLTALRQKWGDEKWQGWCEKLVANKPFVVDGNSAVVRLVGAGEAAIGLTDFDDIAAGQRNKLPIASMPFTDEFLVIASTVAMVRGAPHVPAAKRFLGFAHSQDTVNLLVQANAMEGVKAPEGGLKLKLPADVSGTQSILTKLFARK